MTQDDQQPERPQRGRLSRDTLLLLGALSFLIFAVALTFIFTPGSDIEQPSNQTALALATASPTSTEAAAYPLPSTFATGVGVPVMPTSIPTSPFGLTPGAATAPGLPIGALGSPTAMRPGSLPIPTGNPNSELTRTPQGVAGGVQASPLPTTQPAYPGPIGEGTPPIQPTLIPSPTRFFPTVPSVPTRPPQPTQPPFVPPTFAPQPTAVPQPTRIPQPTAVPQPTEVPLPTLDMSLDVTATPTAEPAPTEGPPPTPAADVIRGNVHWAASISPIILRRDVQIPPDAELVIEPGVEVRLDPGVSIYVDGGRMLAMGLPGQPVRFVGNTGARWSGIFGRPNSYVVLENTTVQGGGGGGTVLAIDESELIIRNSRFSNNGGAILATDTKLEMRNSEVAGNDMPFGPALEASYARGSFITLTGNRFGGNRLSDGTPQVRVINSSTFETLNLAVEGNLIRGGVPNLQLSTNGPLKGTVLCNGLVGGDDGFGLRTQTPQVKPNGIPPLELRVENNFIDEHIPPIIPVYLHYGLGRGATSEVLLEMRNNWWGESSGPYEPDVNPLGRGDSVGSNITFQPWLNAPPPCAPTK